MSSLSHFNASREFSGILWHRVNTQVDWLEMRGIAVYVITQLEENLLEIECFFRYTILCIINHAFNQTFWRHLKVALNFIFCCFLLTITFYFDHFFLSKARWLIISHTNVITGWQQEEVITCTTFGFHFSFVSGLCLFPNFHF